MVDAALGPPSSSSADAPPAAIGSEPAPAAAIPEPQPDAAPAPPASSSSADVDDDGPRLRNAGSAATLRNGDVRRTVYVSADDWRAVLRLAMRQGVTASDVTRAALRDYLRRQARRSTS
jgi:hypothetical protein